MRKINKEWNRQRIADTLAIVGYDPIISIILIANGTHPDITDEKIRYKANIDLLEYLVPRPRKIEINTNSHSEEEEKIKMMKELAEMVKKHSKDY